MAGTQRAGKVPQKHRKRRKVPLEILFLTITSIALSLAACLKNVLD